MKKHDFHAAPVHRSTTITCRVKKLVGAVHALPFGAVVLCAGCAPTLLLSTMENPARTTQKLEANQTYEIGPYKENHQYTVGLADWTPSSIGLHVELRDVDRCASPQAYSFSLVDDHGTRTALRPSADPTTTTQPGREHMTLTIAKMSGVFPAAISGATRYVVVEMRPLYGSGCPALDFKWNLE
jgi:hypothetical protein